MARAIGFPAIGVWSDWWRGNFSVICKKKTVSVGMAKSPPRRRMSAACAMLSLSSTVQRVNHFVSNVLSSFLSLGALAQLFGLLLHRERVDDGI